MAQVHIGVESEIAKASKWKHKKTGKIVTVLYKPYNKWTVVYLMHISGRVTTKQQHYFLYDYELID